ncbi:hypothetical protein Smp_170850 [Schistosoma mansoni]|uniref:Uncharacterized protein n=1 Tax=Schistosoma mansoni TaxID=6183 RepID=G4VLE2_SCHMA|nr:hypothetical protein Smp_170850 [Schistosoma mansoni]|eukprot:XP_018652896.1 hypothetical protein Smp_170850 [Schistosoma mansoni]
MDKNKPAATLKGKKRQGVESQRKTCGKNISNHVIPCFVFETNNGNSYDERRLRRKR